MKDNWGREINYLRLSVTDRCDLHCPYCRASDQPLGSMVQSSLNFADMLRLVKLFAHLGIKKIRLTGGEPLTFPAIEKLIAALKCIAGIEQVVMTTNGLLLSQKMAALLAAGLDGLNISLDTLDEETFAKITGRRGAEQVLQAALSVCEYLPVKINCVPVRGFNEHSLTALAALAKDYPLTVRFIEYMPLGNAPARMGIPLWQVRKTLWRTFGSLQEMNAKAPLCGPARYVKPQGFKGKIGFIEALGHAFCETCNRIRLTSTGNLLPCLGREGYVPLLPLLRKSVQDEEIEAIIQQGIWQKPRGHAFLEAGAQGQIPMRQIGG